MVGPACGRRAEVRRVCGWLEMLKVLGRWQRVGRQRVYCSVDVKPQDCLLALCPERQPRRQLHEVPLDVGAPERDVVLVAPVPDEAAARDLRVRLPALHRVLENGHEALVVIVPAPVLEPVAELHDGRGLFVRLVREDEAVDLVPGPLEPEAHQRLRIFHFNVLIIIINAPFYN